MNRKNLTCIICPMGCAITVELEGKEVLSVTGNTCPRGEKYAREECVNPQRTVTSTVRCSDGSIVPVKTESPIPKDKIFACMEKINSLRPAAPVERGRVLLDDLYGSRLVAVDDNRGGV